MKRIFILLGLVLGACAPAPVQGSVLPEFIDTPASTLDPSYPTAQASSQTSNQSSSGIDVRLDTVWMDGKDVNANICFSLPDGSDWSIYAASLNFAGTILQEYGTTLMSVPEAAGGQAGVRCDTLTFVVPPDADLTSATIVIESIAATPRQDEYCSFYMPKIQQTLLARGIGITLDCTDVNGVLTMQIVNFPPDMTREQAEQIVYNEEFFAIKGPWSFPFTLAQ